MIKTTLINSTICVALCATQILLFSCQPNASKPEQPAPVAQPVQVADTANAVSLYGDSAQAIQPAGVTMVELETAASRGDTLAMRLLADIYSAGSQQVQPNRAKAFRLYRALADLGNVDAKAMSGLMLYNGLGCQQNQGEGIELLVEAANANHADACFFLGQVYMGVLSDTGIGSAEGRQMLTMARLFMEKALNLGVAEAKQHCDYLQSLADKIK